MRWLKPVGFTNILAVLVCGAASAKKSKGQSCKGFQCPSSTERPVPRESFTPRSYGCLELPQLDKCCVERDVCLQTCGMQSKVCSSSFVDCSAKICGSDSTCLHNAEVLGQSTAGRDDKEFCNTYFQGQQASCDCASKYVWKGQLNKRLVDFYRKHAPEKLDASGRLRDADRIWQKWEGNESAMFQSLTMKYWQKAVDLREKPGQSKRSRAKGGSSTSAAKSKKSSTSEPLRKKESTARQRERGSNEKAKGATSDSVFVREIRLLEDRMRTAAKKEDYLTARDLQVQARALREKEIARLEFVKERAVSSEDFELAKSLKADQQKLRGEVQKQEERDEQALKQSEPSSSTHVDRVGSRARLEREDEPLFEAIEDEGEEAEGDASDADDEDSVHDASGHDSEL